MIPVLRALVLVAALAEVTIVDAATQTVTYVVSTINSIAVSGNPGTLTVSAAAAGSQPSPAVNSSTTYAITTNATGQRITGVINSAMPSGVTFQIALAAPAGATSAGTITMSTTAQNLVTGLTKVAQGGLTITYTCSATLTAATGTFSRTVTYTIGP